MYTIEPEIILNIRRLLYDKGYKTANERWQMKKYVVIEQASHCSNHIYLDVALSGWRAIKDTENYEQHFFVEAA